MFEWKHKSLVITGVTGLAVLLVAGVVLTTDNPISDYVQQKYLALRYHVAQYLPAEQQPAFVPTPLDIADVHVTAPTTRFVLTYLSTPPPPSPSPSPQPQATSTEVPEAMPATVPATKQVTAPVSSPTVPAPAPTPTPDVNLVPVQPAMSLEGVKHEYQGWNNCGPTTLKMYLGYYGRADTQKEIAAFTKPSWDDKNVSPNELAAYAEKVGMRALVRENGTMERLKLLLSNKLPVMIEGGFLTPTGKEGWMGHYRLLTGYDDKQFTLMDSFNGPNQQVTFEAIDADWREFNRLYLIVYPDDKEALVRAIVCADIDDMTMFTASAAQARAEILANPKDAFAQFNLGASLNGLQQYTDAAAAFDSARVLGLPWRMMWYQFGPYIAYLQTGRRDEVIALADATLRVVNDLEESHYYKGLALRALGRGDAARREFESALQFNKNYQDAQRALQALSVN